MSPRSTALGLAVACLGLAAHAGPAAAAMPSVVPVDVVGALAGDRVVTVRGEPPHPARVVIRAADGTSARLATLSPPGYRRASVYAESVAASATTWAVALETVFFPDDDEEPDRERGELIVSGPVAGGPARTLASCARDVVDEDFRPIDLAVSSDDVAWSSSSCPGATGVRLAPAGGGPATLVADGSHVRLTPAWVGFSTGVDGRPFVGLLDRATGALRRLDLGTIDAFALGDAGVEAVVGADDPACPSDGDPCRLSIMRVAADGAVVRPGLAATPGGLPGFSVAPLVAGGGRVLGRRAGGNGLVAVDLATGALSYAGALGFGSDDTTPLAVDAADAAYLARRCDGGREVRVEPTVPSPPGRLSFVPCPVRVLTHTLTVRRGHRALLPFVCPRGCDDDWQLDYRGHTVGLLLMLARAGARTRTSVEFANLRRLPRARRFTATLRPDTFSSPSHPRAKPQAPIRIVVRQRR